jgi:hypothetical protein
MVVRVTEVTVVEKPHVADIKDFVVGAMEEAVEILRWLKEV